MAPVPGSRSSDTTATRDLLEHLDTLRDSLGVSVVDLAQLLEVDRTTLWRAFNGKTAVSPRLLSKLLIALGHIAEEAA